jgi:hypothetical protein
VEVVEVKCVTCGKTFENGGFLRMCSKACRIEQARVELGRIERGRAEAAAARRKSPRPRGRPHGSKVKDGAYGRAECIICGGEFARRSPSQKTCGVECRRIRVNENNYRSTKRRFHLHPET